MNENNPQINNQAPQMQTPPVSIPSYTSNLPKENKSSIGSIIGTIIVIAIIILGGLYFWGKRIDEARMNRELVKDQGTTETVVEDDNMEANAIRSVTPSDDLNSIEADLKATNLNNLGSEVNAELE